jgi:DNA-binding NtrC family response regulator
MLPPVQSVLIVEDAEDSRELFALVFEAAGFRTICAASVSEALQVMCSASVDAIVTDFHLPDGNGLAMLDAAAHRGLLQCNVPAVLCTACAEASPTAGRVAAIFIKPVDTNELVRAVHEAIATRREDNERESEEMAS